jgi:hypothetical protein
MDISDLTAEFFRRHGPGGVQSLSGIDEYK